MKRKFWAVALSLVAVLCLAFALTACGGNKTECEKNGHSFATEWTSDTTDHWHKSSVIFIFAYIILLFELEDKGANPIYLPFPDSILFV